MAGNGLVEVITLMAELPVAHREVTTEYLISKNPKNQYHNQ